MNRYRKESKMADKSAFVPVDAIGNHKNTDLDVDIDDELFGKKPPAKSASASAPAPPPPPPPAAPKPAASPAAAAPKFQYKKSSTYSKSYAK
ncbi:unnamed protein product [Caenorhabditis angaria]|uniref:Uncharacterized protein n=1 Tax=Caenorhabditis angaria TaxID=860376 RepID=A0A9P1IPK2_9PELO|nr:unnamed protein product [Caenorhabditis angaria]